MKTIKDFLKEKHNIYDIEYWSKDEDLSSKFKLERVTTYYL